MLVIERLSTDGLVRARSVRQRALRDSPDAFGMTLAEELAVDNQCWIDTLSHARRAVFVAVNNEEDCGLVMGMPNREDESEAYLVAMWVAPSTRGIGAGRALVQSVIDWAKTQQFRAILLDVADSNFPAIELYTRMRFEPTGKTGTTPAPREHITEHQRRLAL